MADFAAAAKAQKSIPAKRAKKEPEALITLTSENLEKLMDEMTTLRGDTQRVTVEMKEPRHRLKLLKASLVDYCERNNLVPKDKSGDEPWHVISYDRNHPEKNTQDGREFKLCAVRTMAKAKLTPALTHEALVKFMRANGNSMPSADQLAEEVAELRAERAEPKITLKWVDMKKLEEKAAAKAATLVSSLPDDSAEVVLKEAYKSARRKRKSAPGSGSDDGQPAVKPSAVL